MKIEIKDFGGIVPSLDEFSLPPNGAQVAENVDLSGGTLRKMALTNPSRRLHDDLGRLVGDVTQEEFGELISKATKVEDGGRIKMANPWYRSEVIGLNFVHFGWLDVLPSFVLEWIDAQSGILQTAVIPLARQCFALDYTTTGFIMSYQMFLVSPILLDPQIDYTIRGPIYQVVLLDTQTVGRHFMGGPDFQSGTNRIYPPFITGASTKVPDIAIPLNYPTKMDKYIPNPRASGLVLPSDNFSFLSPTDLDESVFQYGTLTLDDVDGPHVEETFRPLGEPGTPVPFNPLTDFPNQSIYAHVTFNAHYSDPRPKKHFYMQQNVDASEREGEQSDVSEEFSVLPGEVVRIDTPRPDSIVVGRKLHRSTQSAEGFSEIDFVETSSLFYYDNFRSPIVTRLKPNGSIPHATVVEALFGSIRHPAGYVVYHFERDIRPSAEYEDLERPWAVPLEYAITFDSTVLGMALAGSTIIVFTENRVYRVFGQHPKRLTVALLSEKPILHVRTIWRESNRVGWLNEEGIVVYTEGEQLLTGEYHRAEQWQALNPADFAAEANDRNILLYKPTRDNNLRYDFRGPRLGALSTFVTDDGECDWRWKSKLFQMDNDKSWKACQITATGFPVSLVLYADREKVAEVGITDNNSFLLPRLPRAKGWEFELRGSGEVRDIAVATNIQELARSEI